MNKKGIKIISRVVALIGLLASNAAYVGCMLFWFDEPDSPRSIIER